MKKHIYLVRHGETAFNRSWVYQGADAPLTERGVQQAARVAGVIKEKGVEALIASDAKRAQETAQIISGVINLPIVTQPELHELNRPSYLLGKHFFDPRAVLVFLQLYLQAGQKAWHYQDEENFGEFHDRVATVLRYLENYPGENIAVVTHRILIGGLLTVIRRGPRVSMFAFIRQSLEHGHLANCGTTELLYDSEDTAHPWQIVQVDDTRHLAGL